MHACSIVGFHLNLCQPTHTVYPAHPVSTSSTYRPSLLLILCAAPSLETSVLQLILTMGQSNGLYDWSTQTNPCTGGTNGGPWHGVTCAASGSVTSIDVSSRQLVGTFPKQLSSLTALVSLDMSNNLISGSLPTSLYKLTKLTSFSVAGQPSQPSMIGTIPAQLSFLKSLHTLVLTGNKLTGTVPTQLAALTNLVQLKLASNKLSGSIPPALSSLAGNNSPAHIVVHDNLQMCGSVSLFPGIDTTNTGLGTTACPAGELVLQCMFTFAG